MGLFIKSAFNVNISKVKIRLDFTLQLHKTNKEKCDVKKLFSQSRKKIHML